jgi:hypothetical protein
MASASIFCANTLEVDPGMPTVAHWSEIALDALYVERAKVESLIARRCTCSKSAAKSLLQVEMLVPVTVVGSAPFSNGAFPVFAVSAGNYQLSTSSPPRKSWSSSLSSPKKQRRPADVDALN